MKNFKTIVLLMGIMFSSVILVNICSAEVYTIDNVHSTIGFSVKHMMVSMTKGEFTDYSGRVVFDKNDISAFSADMIIQAKSIDTRNEKRDVHLKGKEFLDVEKYPTISFQSLKLNKVSSGYEITGSFTLHGVTKKITIPVQIAGPFKNPFGGEIMGISGELTINRQDYGITWNKAMDQGGVVVDNNIKLIIEIEAHKK